MTGEATTKSGSSSSRSRRSSSSDVSSRYAQLITHLTQIRFVEPRAGRTAPPELEVGVRLDIDQPGGNETAMEGAPPTHIHASQFHEGAQCAEAFSRYRGVVGIGAGERAVNEHRVVVLDNEPTTRLQRARKARNRRRALWHVNENQARVDEIERSIREWIEADVMTTHIEIAAAFFSQEPWIDIGHQHMTFGSDALGEPESRLIRSRHLSPSTANLNLYRSPQDGGW